MVEAQQSCIDSSSRDMAADIADACKQRESEKRLKHNSHTTLKSET